MKRNFDYKDRDTEDFYSVRPVHSDNYDDDDDKFWSNQDIIFDWKAELTRIESRSFINNFDW